MAAQDLVQASATGAFTFTGNPAADDTVTIGDITYTFKAAPAAANEVDIGADQDASLSNLVSAINADGTAGAYGSGTVRNPFVRAVADTDNNEIDLYARLAGAQGDDISLAESSTAITVAGATLGAVSGATAGVGDLAAELQDILGAGMQPNSQILAVLQSVAPDESF